jgi:hypothetical protein
MAQVKRNNLRVTTQGTLFFLIYSNQYFILFEYKFKRTYKIIVRTSYE